MNINWYPGHMAKTKKQIIEDLKLIDLVIEILDARIPNASRNPDIQDWTKDKKKMVVLNKSDLANDKENKKWVSYFEQNGIPAVLCNCNTGTGIQEVLQKIEKIGKEDQEKYEQKGRIGKSIRIMVVGIPNVGKSSFINRISKKTSTQVGNKPGVTKQKQWIRINGKIELLDTPGILWPRLEQNQTALYLSYTGTIKEEILERIEVAFSLLQYLLKYHKNVLTERYQIEKETIQKILENEDIPENERILEIFHRIGKKRGAILSGGVIDEEKVAGILLDDFRSGKLGKITLEMK